MVRREEEGAGPQRTAALGSGQESQLKDLQTNLFAFKGEVETMHNLPKEKLAHSLHEIILRAPRWVIGR